MNLSWSRVAGADGYIINWVATPKKGTITIKSGSKLKHTHKINVKPLNTYVYTITAYKLNGSKKILSAKKTIAIIPTVNLSVPSRDQKSAVLSWKVTKAYGNVGSYNVSMVVDGKTTVIKTGLKTTLSSDKTVGTASYKATNLIPGKTYNFYITDKKTNSKSNTVTIKIPLPNVQGFQALSSHDGAVLKWNKVSGATGYDIVWKSTDGSTGRLPINNGNTTSFFHRLYTNRDFTYSIKAVNKEGNNSTSVANAVGSKVLTMGIRVYLKTARTLTSHSGGSVTTTFPKGTRIDAVGFTGGKYIFYYQGRIYHVKRISTYNAGIYQSAFNKTYSNAEAESFVNRLGLSSNTAYLIWVNTYTQKEYILKGGKGNWKVISGPHPVSTGTPDTPTSTGMTRIGQKDYSQFDSYFWSVCSVFSIHSKPRSQHKPLGYPYSSACIRNPYDIAKWIYYNCPIGTAVYVY